MTNLSEEEKAKIIEEERFRAQQRRKVEKKKTSPAAWGCLTLLIIGIIAAIAASSGGGSEKKTTTDTSDREATEQASVASSSNSNLTPEEQVYFNEITPIISDHSRSFSGLTEIVNSGTSPLLWTDKERITVAAHLGVIIASHERASKIIPPPHFQAAHDKVLVAFQSHREAARLFAEGLDATDEKLIEQAAAKLLEGTAQIRDARKELDQLIKK